MNTYEYKPGAGNLFPVPVSNGVSPDAKEIGDKLRLVSDSARRTVSFGGGREKAITRLSEAYIGAQEDNWAGTGSLRVTTKTLRNALRFIDVLPLDVPTPEINAEPDGYMAFEWRHAPYRVISVSVGEKSELPFAALISENRLSGKAIFRDSLPQVVAEHIKSVYSAR